LPNLQKGLKIRLYEHGDVIETQTIKFHPNSVPDLMQCHQERMDFKWICVQHLHRNINV